MFRAMELYSFMNYCEDSSLEKVVLDCGAGFRSDLEPLLLRFHQRGYRVHGIELSPERVANAEAYRREHGINLNIQQGDLRALPFADESMSFVYSWNTIFHMTKADMAHAVAEIERVLRPEGLCFVNFLSVEDGACGEGTPIGPGEFWQDERGEQVIHAYLEDNEADAYFAQCRVLEKVKRVHEWATDDGPYRGAIIDYYVQKA